VLASRNDESWKIELSLPDRKVKVFRKGEEVPPEEWNYNPVHISPTDGGIEVRFADNNPLTTAKENVSWNDEVFRVKESGFFRRIFDITREASGGGLRHVVYINGEVWFRKPQARAPRKKSPRPYRR